MSYVPAKNNSKVYKTDGHSILKNQDPKIGKNNN